MIEARISRPLYGVFWMLATGLVFVAVTALVKSLGTALPASEAAFLRFALGLVLLLPLLKKFSRLKITATQWKLFLLRGAIHSVGVAFWFFAMARIPLADVTAMNYLSPILITIGAAIFLGEKLHVRRIGAVIAGLIGALIILRPGLREIGAGHLAMLATASCFAASYMISKRLSDDSDPALIVAMLSVTVTIGLAPMALPVWVAPDLTQLVTLFAVAVLATAGHLFMTLAFKEAPMTVTQPVTFLQLVWSVLVGALVFHEAVDPFVILGGVLILSAVSFITWREAVLKRREITPPAV
ncbi:DMT family transporter [Pseudooceanicola algae]|uniref:Riboflavin transporter n=1 Tax=Pseudooceanicola algae TaxID=1537215 RepID=A0A418SJG9_9RHOB|nr:DMT family transporter [Pseudooceanicola algae]QPM91899.1 Riboflavin transporter [Pseudooceanicola algae]